MLDEATQKELKRIKNLSQYKNKSDEDLLLIASANIKRKSADIGNKFNDPIEQEEARRLYNKYITNYPNLNPSQLELVEDLIVHIINKNYTQKQIDNIKSEKKSVPPSLFEQLQNIEEHIFELKQKIGLDQDNGNTELTGLQTLQKKFESYINSHKEEFTTVCSCCGTMLLLRRRIKDFDIIEHPWFAGRWFFNYEILKDVKEGKITKEDAWRYLCSASKGSESKPAFNKQYTIDYIDHVLKHWAEITNQLEKSNE
jgi:hypothetical protein